MADKHKSIAAKLPQALSEAEDDNVHHWPLNPGNDRVLARPPGRGIDGSSSTEGHVTFDGIKTGLTTSVLSDVFPLGKPLTLAVLRRLAGIWTSWGNRGGIGCF